MPLKQVALRLLEGTFRSVGDRNRAFTYALDRHPDHRHLSIYDRPSTLARYRQAVTRLMVKVSSFERPIVKTVHYHPDGAEPFTIALDITDYTQLRYFYAFPDPRLRDLIVAGGDTFVDVGANVGVFSLLASRFFRQVHAFEPLPPTYARLAGNCRATPSIHVYPAALSSSDGVTRIHQSAIGSGGSSLRPLAADQRRVTRKDAWHVYDVPQAKADDLLRDLRALDLMKIDVEGHEVEVLQGAAELVRAHRPILFVEIGDDRRFEAIRRLLPPNHFVFDPVSNVFSDARRGPDTIFVWDNKLPVIGRVFGVRP